MTGALNFHDILFATDFSEVARLAGQTAADLARRFGARLHVLHVVPPVTDPVSDPTPAPTALKAAATELAAGLSPVTAVVAGRAASQIVNYARRHAIGLIVLGTHGRTGMSHALLGSVAEAVVRRAPCRVLTVPLGAAGTPAPMPVDDIPDTTSCIVCGKPSQGDLVCESCRARIRGEALEHKRAEERPGRR